MDSHMQVRPPVLWGWSLAAFLVSLWVWEPRRGESESASRPGPEPGSSSSLHLQLIEKWNPQEEGSGRNLYLWMFHLMFNKIYVFFIIISLSEESGEDVYTVRNTNIKSEELKSIIVQRLNLDFKMRSLQRLRGDSRGIKTLSFPLIEKTFLNGHQRDGEELQVGRQRCSLQHEVQTTTATWTPPRFSDNTKPNNIIQWDYFHVTNHNAALWHVLMGNFSLVSAKKNLYYISRSECNNWSVQHCSLAE